MPAESPGARAAPASTQARIGRYELISEIGRGPEAALWVARVSEGAELGRLVAVRRIAKDHIDPPSLERMLAAIAVAKRVRDPHLVAVLDSAVGDREVAVISEYIEGEPVRSLQRLALRTGAPVPIAVAVRLGLDLLTGVRAAYEQAALARAAATSALPSLHGCITPDCALVASFGDTMLCDLAIGGLANAVDAIALHATALPYWAPERFDGPDVDEQADVFSVGVLLWELIANRPLFSDGATADRNAMAAKIRTAPIPRLETVRRPGQPVSQRVADVVARALHRDRKARFETLEAMTSAMFALDGSIATADEVVMTLYRLARPVLDARRAALGQLTDMSSRDSVPESTRGTYRPPAATVPAEVVPALPRIKLPRLGALEPVGPVVPSKAPTPPKSNPESRGVPPPAPSSNPEARAKPPPPPRSSAGSRPMPPPPPKSNPEARATPPPPPKSSNPEARATPPPPPAKSNPTARPVPPPPPSSQSRNAPPPTPSKPAITAAPAESAPALSASRRDAADNVPPGAFPKPAPLPKLAGADAPQTDDTKGPFGWASADASRIPPAASDVEFDDAPPDRRRRAIRNGAIAIAAFAAAVVVAFSLRSSHGGADKPTQVESAASATPSASPDPTASAIATTAVTAPAPPPPPAEPATNAPTAPTKPDAKEPPTRSPPSRGSPPSTWRPPRGAPPDRAKPAATDDTFRPHGI